MAEPQEVLVTKFQWLGEENISLDQMPILFINETAFG